MGPETVVNRDECEPSAEGEDRGRGMRKGEGHEKEGGAWSYSWTQAGHALNLTKAVVFLIARLAAASRCTEQ